MSNARRTPRGPAAPPERTELHDYIRPVEPVIRQFIEGQFEGSDFELPFLAVYSELPGIVSGSAFEASQRFFFSVEDHVEDRELRESGDISTEELRARARTFLREAGYEVTA